MAPFLVIKLCLSTIFGWFGNKASGGLAFDVIAIFLIALCFYMAERHERFRQFYVHFAPALTGVGLFYWMGQQTGFFNVGYFVLALLIWVFAVRVWRFTTKHGYRVLSDGGDRKFSKARTLYENGDYDKALPLLEKSAAKGHFRSLYLIGEAYEMGRLYEANRLKAAEYYLKSGKKGWHPAREKFKAIFGTLTVNEQKRLESEMLVNWLD